jgi:hypothetical protein
MVRFVDVPEFEEGHGVFSVLRLGKRRLARAF